MDFQYCDRCGDITKTNHSSGNELLCENCATNGAGGSAPPAPSAPPTGLDVLSDPGPSAPAPGPEPSANELDFFSNDTLAMRREPPKPKGPSKLKLVSDAEPATGFQNPAAPAPAPAAAPPAGLGGGNNDMGMTQPMGGTIYPSKPDERWRVDCLHCAGSLSIKPAVKRSKLRCPRCRGVMILDPSGQVESIGSTVVQRKGTAKPPSAVIPAAPAPSAPAASALPPAPTPVPTPKAPANPAPSGFQEPMTTAPTPTEAFSPAALLDNFGGAPGVPDDTALSPIIPPAPETGGDLGKFERSFLDPNPPNPRPSAPPSEPSLMSSADSFDIGGGSSTAVAPPPTMESMPPAPAPIPEVTAPIAGGGQTQFAIAPDEDTLESEDRAAALVSDHPFTEAGVPTMTRIENAPQVAERTTVGNATAFLWVTIAMAPCLLGIVAVHESIGPLGQAFLQESGARVSENAGKLLDWVANALGR